MKCPKCRKAPPNFTGKLRDQTGIDEELDQQRRVRWCLFCGNEWETVEVEYAELQRLRSLAHRQVMSTTQPKQDYRPWRHEA